MGAPQKGRTSYDPVRGEWGQVSRSCSSPSGRSALSGLIAALGSLAGSQPLCEIGTHRPQELTKLLAPHLGNEHLVEFP